MSVPGTEAEQVISGPELFSRTDHGWVRAGPAENGGEQDTTKVDMKFRITLLWANIAVSAGYALEANFGAAFALIPCQSSPQRLYVDFRGRDQIHCLDSKLARGTARSPRTHAPVQSRYWSRGSHAPRSLPVKSHGIAFSNYLQCHGPIDGSFGGGGRGWWRRGNINQDDEV